MAEMQTSQGGGKKKGSKVRGKKMSTRVDLTPMVDLAFLLLTFFMMTTTFNKPKVMELATPEEPKDTTQRTKIKESTVLVLMLSDRDRIYWYDYQDNGDPPTVTNTDFSESGVRKIILDKKSRVEQQHGLDDRKKWDEEKKDSIDIKTSKLITLIKPDSTSNFKNLVDILDEMAINDVTKFVLTDITDKERQMIADAKAAEAAATGN